MSLRFTFFAFGAELLMQMKTLVKHKPVMIALYTWAMVMYIHSAQLPDPVMLTTCATCT